MRPALQRLLGRPQSLDLLRYLLGNSARETPGHQSTVRLAQAHSDSGCRMYFSMRALIQEPDEAMTDAPSQSPPVGQLQQCRRLYTRVMAEMESGSRRPIAEDSEDGSTVGDFAVGASGISFEDDDLPGFGHDFGLWDTFLKGNGELGVLGLWNSIQSRDLILPTEGRVADSIWRALLNLGSRDRKFLGEICDYANAVFETSGKRWPLLYTHIMRTISNQSRKEAVYWHNRLVAGGHSPGPEAFRQFMRVMAFSTSHPEVVKTIYTWNKHRNAYSKVMRTLIHHIDLRIALDWHLFLIRNGDFPNLDASRYVGTLLDYLIRSTSDLEFELHRVAALIAAHDAKHPMSDIEDAVEQSALLHITPQIPKQKMTIRELINLSEGEAFHIAPKKYNDGLGARWLATRWVSLDFAIKTLSSLGIPSIGPLSLQAIAMREPDTASVLRYILQLKELGISIGTSVFSRAVLSFAQNGQQEYMTALLQSDQHPDALEDGELQQKLLSNYALLGDWGQYRRTVAVQLAIARDSQTLSHDIALKRHATTGSWPNIFDQLEKMYVQGILVQQVTAHYIVRRLLGQRGRGKEMIKTRQNWLNLEMAINILTLILERNGQVSPLIWREIFRRLGALGRLDEIERLSLWLAVWYEPRLLASSHVQHSLWRSDLPYRTKPLSWGNSMRTLRLLFPPAFQRTIIEWSFIHTSPTNSPSSSHSIGSNTNAQMDQYAQGIRILRRLRENRVEINMPAVRSALRNRLAILFGNGTSLLSRNRILRAMNRTSFEEVLLRLDQEWGGQIWAEGTKGGQLVAARVERGMRRRRRAMGKRRDGMITSHGVKIPLLH